MRLAIVVKLLFLRDELVKPALIDTDILSLFFRGNAIVIANFQTYLAEHFYIQLSIVTYYEMLSGLKHRDAQRQLAQFLQFAAQNTILPLTLESVNTLPISTPHFDNVELL